MCLARWLSLVILLSVATLASSLHGASRLAAHVERLREAWQAAERAGNIKAASVLCHFSQARRTANRLFAKFAQQGDVEAMQLLIDLPLLDFNSALGVAAGAGQTEVIAFIDTHGGNELDFDAALETAAGGDDDDKALIAVQYLVEQQLATALGEAEQIAQQRQNHKTAQYLRDTNF